MSFLAWCTLFTYYLYLFNDDLNLFAALLLFSVLCIMNVMFLRFFPLIFAEQNNFPQWIKKNSTYHKNHWTNYIFSHFNPCFSLIVVGMMCCRAASISVTYQSLHQCSVWIYFARWTTSKCIHNSKVLPQFSCFISIVFLFVPVQI